MDDSDARWVKGLAAYREVYGDDLAAFERGTVPSFDLMIEQLFAEIWTRRALPIPERRLLSMGVLAAQREYDILRLQFERAMRIGELNAEQVHECVIHLIQYIGYPASRGLREAAEAAIAAVEADPA